MRLEQYNLSLEGMRSDWAKHFNDKYDGSKVCPMCGQMLPPEQIAEAENRFNEIKAKTLEDIDRKAKAVTKEIENIKSELSALEKEYRKGCVAIASVTAKTNEAGRNTELCKQAYDNYIEKSNEEINAKKKAERTRKKAPSAVLLRLRFTCF